MLKNKWENSEMKRRRHPTWCTNPDVDEEGASYCFLSGSLLVAQCGLMNQIPNKHLGIRAGHNDPHISKAHGHFHFHCHCRSTACTCNVIIFTVDSSPTAATTTNNANPTTIIVVRLL